MNANGLGFRGLSPKTLFHTRVKWFTTFYDKIKPLIESKDSKIHFCNKFIICRLNMYLKVLLYYLRYQRTSCNKVCIFPNSADFKDRIFELPIFCSLHELVGKYISFTLVVLWQQPVVFKFVKNRIFRTHPSFYCCHPVCSFD